MKTFQEKKFKQVLIFSTAYFPFVGGAEVAIKEITERIDSSVFQFDLITARMDKKLAKFEQMGQVGVHRVGFGLKTFDKILLPFLGTVKTFSILKKKKIDLFWSVMVSFSGGIPYIVNILRFWEHTPVVLTLQEGDSEEHINKKRFGMIQASWRLALKRTDFLTVISKYLKNRARHYGYKGQIEIIPNAVDVSLFAKRYSEEELTCLKQELKKNPEDKFLITTSRLNKKNALDDVIKSLEYLSKNIKFLVLGEGEDLGKLKKLSEELGVEDRVLFLGKIDYKEIPKYLKISDAFIRPSLSEGFGNSFVEAMASELPVIATPVGGIVDFLFDPDKNPEKKATGLFCEVRNPKSIASTVERMLSDTVLQEEIIKNGREMVFEKYDWNIVAKDMREKVFDKVL